MQPFSKPSFSHFNTAREEIIFIPFTSASYQKLVERERVRRALEIKRAKYAQVAHLVDGELRFGAQEDESILPEENSDLKDGRLFTKTYGTIPNELLGVPIEEIDAGVREKTFVIINSRCKKKYIHRFTATKSLFIFTPWNPVRRITLAIATHQLFDVFIFMTIVINCILLAMTHISESVAEKLEHIFLSIYTLECILKIVGKGFIFSPYTYLRDPWNWLDFIVIVTGFLSARSLTNSRWYGLSNNKGLRTFRVLRALRTFSFVPGLKTIVSALLRAVRMLIEVMLLTVFCLMIFSVIAMKAFSGILRQKCVLEVTGYIPNPSQSYNDYYIEWVRDPDNWYRGLDDEYSVCGNNTGAGLCPNGYICLPNIGDNPRFGLLNFDHFGYAALASFQLIALDFWEDIYNKITRAIGPWSVIFFIIIVFFGSFFLLNLMLAVVSISYEEEALNAGKERDLEKKENARKKHNALYRMSQYNLKKGDPSRQLLNLTLENASPDNDFNVNVSQNQELIPDDTELPSKFKKVLLVANAVQGASHQDSKTVTIIKADVLLDPEVGVLDHKLIDRNCDCCEKWLCFYPTLLRVQNYVYMFVSDPLFDFLITVAIVLNTFFMSLDHHNQPASLQDLLEVLNKVFAVIFTAESILKMTGLGKYYFLCGWNIFDLIAVIASLVDLARTNIAGLSVLRIFRLFRVLKLAQSWPTMRLLVTIIVSTLGALGNLCVILCIIIYIFAVFGLNLLRENQGKDKGTHLRWGFSDFYHAMLMIFRVLCGEWIEPLYSCMPQSGEICFLLYLPALVFGNFIVLNLFLALLLNAFASDSLDRLRDTSNERSKLSEGWQRMKDLLLCCCIKKKNSARTGRFKSRRESVKKNSNRSCLHQPANMSNIESTVTEVDEAESVIGESNCTDGGGDTCTRKHGSDWKDTEAQQLEDKSDNSQYQRSKGIEKKLEQSKKRHHPKVKPKSVRTFLGNWSNNSFRSYSDEDLNSTYVEDYESGRESIGAPPPDCFQPCVYKRCKCLNYIPYTKCWKNLRIKMKKLVDDQKFQMAVFFIIIVSSLTLVFEDIYLYQYQILDQIIKWCNVIFAVLFTIEMLIKWIGLGLTVYFTNAWTVLDFAIVLVSVLSLMGDATHSSSFTGFRSLRTLRAFRPLRAVSRWHGMKIVVNALINAIPAIMNVFLVCMVFWLIFSIMGVQLFKGKFYRCIDVDTHDQYDYTIVPNHTVCNNINATWQNLNINFDSTANGFLALLQVATFEGWMELMQGAVDAYEEEKQPKFENNPYAYLYFIVFIVIGSFFSLNLFIGVIIDNFNVLKKKYEGNYLDAFMTQSQRNYYNILKKVGTRKPKKTVKRPQNKFMLFFYDLVVSSRFEMSVILTIFLNMVINAVYHYNESKLVVEFLDSTNIAFTTIFALEIAVKIIGLRIHFFHFALNIFDLVVVLLSACAFSRPLFANTYFALILDKVLSTIIVTPNLLRLLRFFQIGRVLRLLKSAKGIRKLFFAITISLPAVFNIGALLFMIMFVYAIIGMSSFGTVRLTGVLDEVVNFRTFGSSFLLVLRLSTAAGWNDILEALLIKEPFCDPTYYTLPDDTKKHASHGDCGIPYLAIPYMVSYIIIVWLIVVNMYIAVLLENFNQAHQQEEVGIAEDDFDMFYTVWEKYDPIASQFIKCEQLTDFVADLDPPFQIPRPNEIALVTFNIPILEGDKMHCLDILIALVTYVLTEVDDTHEFKTLKMQIESKFFQHFPARHNTVVKSTTLQRKKEDVAARTLQRSWRSFKAQRAMQSITADAQKLKLMREHSSAVGFPTTNIMIGLTYKLELALDKFFRVRKEAWDPFETYNASML